MGQLEITVGGDLHFTARWESAAPQTIEAIRRMLPIDSKLIHCRWSGESTWIPYGEFRPGIDNENVVEAGASLTSSPWSLDPFDRSGRQLRVDAKNQRRKPSHVVPSRR